MKSSWLAGLTEQERNECKGDFIAAGKLRERLTVLLNDKCDVARTSGRAKISYETANWPYLQADLVGYERALFEVISLISNDPVEN